MWNESIDKDKNKGAMCFGVSRVRLQHLTWMMRNCRECGWMRYASCYRMCAIYISKSNFIRRALCIHLNRIWIAYIWLDRFFIWCCAELWRRRNKKKNKIKKHYGYGGYMSNIGNASDIQIKWTSLPMNDFIRFLCWVNIKCFM